MALFNLNNEYEKADCKSYFEKMYKKGGFIEIKRKLPKRTLKQNAYLHLILGFLGTKLGYSVQEVKDEVFRKVNKDIFYREYEYEGKTFHHWRSTTKLDTGEMTRAIERFRDYSSSQLGVYLPSPNETDNLVYCQQEVERHAEFIEQLEDKELMNDDISEEDVDGVDWLGA